MGGEEILIAKIQIKITNSLKTIHFTLKTDFTVKSKIIFIMSLYMIEFISDIISQLFFQVAFINEITGSFTVYEITQAD